MLKDQGAFNTRLVFPFFKTLIPGTRVVFLLFAVFVLAAESNAVNLTDGLDGLAISIFAIAAAAFTALSYVGGATRLRQLPADPALQPGRPS